MSQSSRAGFVPFNRLDQKRAMTAKVARMAKTMHTATVARALSVEKGAGDGEAALIFAIGRRSMGLFSQS